MRRWRDRICRLTSLFVTPTADILPAWVDRGKVLEVEWGADVRHFRPDVPGDCAVRPRSERVLCVFAGAFRSWHGAMHLAAALARLHQAGDSRFGGVFIGDGPERAAVERVARDVPGVHVHRRAAARSAAGRACRTRTSAWRRSIRRGTRRCGSASTGRR